MATGSLTFTLANGLIVLQTFFYADLPRDTNDAAEKEQRGEPCVESIQHARLEILTALRNGLPEIVQLHPAILEENQADLNKFYNHFESVRSRTHTHLLLLLWMPCSWWLCLCTSSAGCLAPPTSTLQ